MVILPLVVSNASVRKRQKTLVGPVSLTLAERGFTVVLGPNGAGKTSLLRMLHGLLPCASGAVKWAVPTEKARPKQAFVFQSPVMMRRNVADSLTYPLRLRGVSRAEARAQALTCAKRFGLADLLESWAPQLSGGEQQKLSLARALITAPEILFLDEPCASLDGRTTREIEEILLAEQARGTRLVMSTHNIGQAQRLAEDVVFMMHGQIHEQGPADRFFAAATTPEARAYIKGDIVE